jgi:hypothetical protein
MCRVVNTSYHNGSKYFSFLILFFSVKVVSVYVERLIMNNTKLCTLSVAHA